MLVIRLCARQATYMHLLDACMLPFFFLGHHAACMAPHMFAFPVDGLKYCDVIFLLILLSALTMPVCYHHINALRSYKYR